MQERREGAGPCRRSSPALSKASEVSAFRPCRSSLHQEQGYCRDCREALALRPGKVTVIKVESEHAVVDAGLKPSNTHHRWAISRDSSSNTHEPGRHSLRSEPAGRGHDHAPDRGVLRHCWACQGLTNMCEESFQQIDEEIDPPLPTHAL